MTPRQMETLGRRIAVEVKASVEPVAAGTYSILYVVIWILLVGYRILVILFSVSFVVVLTHCGCVLFIFCDLLF